jgi:carbonic anhydrase/acetyltransferase-like protein (isoleucine patch superfamily)
MATLVELDGVAPTIGRDVWLAPTAVIIGDVHIGDRTTVWWGAVLRGDLARIEIGAETSIQDMALVHADSHRPTIIGSRVTIGHHAMLEGCVIEDGALVGMGAIVLHDARVGAGAVVAAGTVVPDRGEVAPGVLAAGVPAKEKKRLEGATQTYPQRAADEYQQLRERYLTASTVRDSDDSVATP